MILALLVFKLQLTSQPDGGHFASCQFGGARQQSKQYDMSDLWGPQTITQNWNLRTHLKCEYNLKPLNPWELCLLYT